MDQVILKTIEKGRTAWPGVQVEAQQFSDHLDGLGAERGSLLPNGEDLLLAFACSQRDPVALGYFHDVVLPRLFPYLRRLHSPDASAEDLQQELCLQLLTGRPPGIGRYAGRGPLLGWLRVIATRMAAARRTRPPEVVVEDPAPLTSDPEVRALRGSLGERIRKALTESLAALPPQRKELLRLHYADGQNIEAIGARYRCHRATAARRLARIRSQVMSEMCGRLARPARAASVTGSELAVLVDDLADELCPVLRVFLYGQEVATR